MRKVILFVVLTILFLSFVALLFNAYNLQKNYFLQKSTKEVHEIVPTPSGVPSYYKDYFREDYDKALNERHVLVLYFTANWCKECLVQEEVNKEVFNELTKEGVIGLKIHILDSETTIETDALAKKFDVTKEQSFVVLNKNGAVYFKYTGVLGKDLLKQKILEAGDSL